MPEPRQQLTPQQDAALRVRDVSVALSAGAGCGKTFVLTERFLAHLQPGGDHDPLSRIVAITFTERAAREMRDRIRAACHAELQRCAAEKVPHWLKVLRGLDAARISTIHSFCASLLRAYAVDAGVDPQFGVLESSRAAALLRRAVRESVHELLSKHDADCMQLVLHYGFQRTRDLIRTLVLERFGADFGRFEQFTPEGLAAEWLRRWNDEFVPRLLREFSESPVVSQVIRLLGENEPRNAEMQRRREFLLEHLRVGQAFQPATTDRQAGKPAPPLALLAELRGAAQVQGGGGKKVWKNDTVYEAVKDALSRLRKSLQRLQEHFQIDEQHVHAAARLGLTALRVARRAGEHYETQKQSAGVLDFDDLLLRARNLLRDNPAVCSRAAAGIDFLMIDEFQDTDAIQSEIIRLLCGEQLAGGKLFLVGDRKQSIYRFRRADPAVFATLREQLPERGRLPLSTNFRSQPEILKFVNCVFAPSMGPAYEPLVPHLDEQLSPTPAIEFLFASGERPADAENKAVTECGAGFPACHDRSAGWKACPTTKEAAPHRRGREAVWIARRIRELLSDETPRIRLKNNETGRFELRPLQLGDVAILFRTLTNVAIYEDALRREGIDYYLVGGRAFYAQQEIYDLVNLCSFLDDCDDQVALVGVLRSPFFSFSDESLCTLVRESGTVAEALAASIPPPDDLSAIRGLSESQQRQVRHASAVLAELRRKKDRLPLAELLNLALERTGYDAALLNEFLGRRKLANLRKLIDMARQFARDSRFDRSGLFTMKEFVERMRESVTEQTDEELAATHPETSDVIRLMTIHQAKGLEFPVVVLADMDWSRRGGAGFAHFHPELGPLVPLAARHGETPKNLGLEMHKLVEAAEDELETVRLLYVAMTRAADYLILSAGLGPNRKGASPWLKLLAERFDLQTGLPVRDPYLGRCVGQAFQPATTDRQAGKPAPLSLGDVSAPDIPRIADIPQIGVHHRVPGVKKGTGPICRDGPQGAVHKLDLSPFSPAQLPLSRFRDAVEQAEPATLPPMLQRLSPNLAAVRQFSVSEIEEADAELQSPSGSRAECGAGFPACPDRSAGWKACPTTVASLSSGNGGGKNDLAPGDATVLGTLVHAVLERIDFHRPGAIEPLLDACIRTATETISDAVRSGARARLQAFSRSSLAAELAEMKQCFREIDFLLRWPIGAKKGTGPICRDGPQGATHKLDLSPFSPCAPHPVMIVGQIDCLCQHGSGRWTILDYKTGGAGITDDRKLLAKYEIQLALYALSVRQLIGRTPDSVELALLEEPVRRIPLELSDHFFASMMKRVDAAIQGKRKKEKGKREEE